MATSLHQPDPSQVHARERYQDRQVADNYDRVRFTRPIGRLIDALEKRAVQRALKAVRQLCPCPRVLDTPCGTGRITELLLHQGWTVTGGDISQPMMDIARRKLSPFGDRVGFCQLDIEDLQLPERSFDLITCIRLLNHLLPAERARALREMARVSRRFVIVNVSFASSLYRLKANLKSAFGIVRPKEPFSWKQLHEQAAEAGLRIREYHSELPVLSEVVVLLMEKLETAERAG
jgi:ubiquinone/menaquinone biosynthesis C-methylase UbiE